MTVEYESTKTIRIFLKRLLLEKNKCNIEICMSDLREEFRKSNEYNKDAFIWFSVRLKHISMHPPKYVVGVKYVGKDPEYKHLNLYCIYLDNV